jgi:type II secretory pathway pseudopilin PulG
MKLRGQHGYAMAALLVGLGIMAVMMTVVMPVWKQTAQREKEAELVFRGEQYARAIELYGRKLPGALPPNLDVLVDQKFLRKKYKDPITGGDFDLVSPAVTPGPQRGAQQPGGLPPAGRGQGQVTVPNSGRGGTPAGPGSPVGIQGGITAVVSKSKDTSIRLYKGRGHYNEWVFEPVRRAQAPGVGAPGTATPGQRGGPGQQPIGPGGVNGPGGPGRRGGPSTFPGPQTPPGSPFPGRGPGGATPIRPPGN